MIRMFRRGVALCALLLSIEGCYTGTADYVRPHAVIHGDRTRVLSAVQETVAARGLRIVRVQPERGLVVAVTPPTSVNGLKAREHWSIHVRGADVAVEMHPETALEDGDSRWERDLQVCDCYHYAREREMLRAIRERLRGRAPASL